MNRVEQESQQTVARSQDFETYLTCQRQKALSAQQAAQGQSNSGVVGDICQP